MASPKVTVVDNGTIAGRRGSLNVDDEGSPTHETVLIENGVLKGYLSDKLSARLMNMPNTGSGRRQSYQCIPMPRMTNTYMLAGDDAPEVGLALVTDLVGRLRRTPGLAGIHVMAMGRDATTRDLVERALGEHFGLTFARPDLSPVQP